MSSTWLEIRPTAAQSSSARAPQLEGPQTLPTVRQGVGRRHVAHGHLHRRRVLAESRQNIWQTSSQGSYTETDPQQSSLPMHREASHFFCHLGLTQ
jgi:hypothetical protein